MKSYPVELRKDEIVRAMSGTLHSITRPVDLPEGIEPEVLGNSQVVYSETKGGWVLISGDGNIISGVRCPYEQGAWLWVQEPHLKAADSADLVFKADLPEDACEWVEWNEAGDLESQKARFSLRVRDVKIAFAQDPVKGLVQSWLVGVFTYPSSIQYIPETSNMQAELVQLCL